MTSNQRDQANAQSMTMAVGWSGLFNGMSGEGGTKTSAKDLLPYPGQIEDRTQHRLAASTQIILKSLHRSGKLKPQVMAVLQPLMAAIER